MGFFVQIDGDILKYIFGAIYYGSEVETTSPMSNPYIYLLYFSH